jgi:hypothetical protein
MKCSTSRTYIVMSQLTKKVREFKKINHKDVDILFSVYDMFLE